MGIQRGEKGFTLIEVLIAGGLLLTLAMAGTSIIVRQTANITYLEDRMSKADLEREILYLLDSPQACVNSLAGRHILLGAKGVELKDQSGTVRFSASGTTARYDFLKITALEVRNKSIAAASQSGVAEVAVTFERLRKGGGPAGPFHLAVPVLATLDVAGKIDTCQQAGAAPVPTPTSSPTPTGTPSPTPTPTGVIADLCTCNGGPLVGCGCCAPGKTWELVGSMDQDEKWGQNRACMDSVLCPPQKNKSDWMIFICAARN
ncbi:MAG: prepilin-type N-terminal cleavage/methylation domain-containing protein [Oligoflexia bacterium]|nr:prepilin-type N-terminal cleavage/methylation domain-containing protein [Oligoflexia bacterium]